MAIDDDPGKLPEVDSLYANYLETCRRLNVTPVTLGRAADLVAEWNAIIQATRQTKH